MQPTAYAVGYNRPPAPPATGVREADAVKIAQPFMAGDENKERRVRETDD
jgi:hypothetical protein